MSNVKQPINFMSRNPGGVQTYERIPHMRIASAATASVRNVAHIMFPTDGLWLPGTYVAVTGTGAGSSN